MLVSATEGQVKLRNYSFNYSLIPELQTHALPHSGLRSSPVRETCLVVLKSSDRMIKQLFNRKIFVSGSHKSIVWSAGC